jgi:hypothetical protein
MGGLIGMRRFVIAVVLGAVTGTAVTKLLELAGWSFEPSLASGFTVAMVICMRGIGAAVIRPVQDGAMPSKPTAGSKLPPPPPGVGIPETRGGGR